MLPNISIFVHLSVTASLEIRTIIHFVLQRKLVSREEKPVLGLWWRGCPVAGLLPEGPRAKLHLRWRTAGQDKETDGPGSCLLYPGSCAVASAWGAEEAAWLGTEGAILAHGQLVTAVAHRGLPSHLQRALLSPRHGLHGPPWVPVCCVLFPLLQSRWASFRQIPSSCPAPPGRRASAHAFSVGWNSPCHHLFT